MTGNFRQTYLVDVIIRGWNNLELTQRCIDSITLNTEQPAFQITYVDNGSDDIKSFVAQYSYGLQTVLLPFNHGSVRAINVGLSLAMFSPSKYILLLDNDTEIPEGDKLWLQRLVDYFEADEKVGAVGAVSDYVSGFQHADKTFDIFQKAFEGENGEKGLGEPPEIPLLVSFAMMLRKSAVEEIGWFDEAFEPGNCEDYDYSLRLREAGYKCLVANSVWMHHKGSQTFSNLNFGELLQTNMNKLIQKWGVSKLKQLGLQVQQ
jgi:O-antigen biosynthesis protein